MIYFNEKQAYSLKFMICTTFDIGNTKNEKYDSSSFWQKHNNNL